ncbi:hypothetical protein DVH05_025852 [Phytophthora capsici]|nr:hypothetical protein DVH05_025852 [Phytophthora capsici]
MKTFTYATEKDITQMWRELSNKGWKFRKSRGLSNDGRYLPPGGSVQGTEGVDYFLGNDSLMAYCRKQGWLAYGTAASPAVDVLPAAPRGPEADPTSSLSTQTSGPPPPARKLVSKPPAVDQGEREAATPPVASSKRTSRTPKQAAKATPRALTAAHHTTEQHPRAEGKRKATVPNSSTKRRRSDCGATDTAQVIPDMTEHAVQDTTQRNPDTTEQAVQNATQRIPDTTDQAVPERAMESEEGREQETTETLDGGATRYGVSLDDFDSDEFLAALRRDRLFDDGDVGVFNAGDGDWLLALDSDTEGDENSILQDESDDDVGDDDVVVDGADESDDENAVELVEVPVEFDLTRADLVRLQAEEWDVYMEQEAGRVLHDASPLYDGPSGPTRAALAYAEDPLAIFYFFLPKELWRRIATGNQQVSPRQH